jgi:alanine dehydrogenase
MSETLFERLVRELVHRSANAPFARRSVDFLLGTDRFIGRKQHAIEKRVGVTPAQIRKLHDAFKSMHLGLHTFVIAGAGARAGYADCDYVHAGAEIIGLDELEWLDGPPDVVHALKEPSSYEARIPKPFCRIGALHSGDFDGACGLADLLVSGPVAVFDGSNIGASRAFRIPIRGRMSKVAGQIAGEWMIEQLDRRRASACRAIVVGGGCAGQAALRQLLGDARCAKVHLFDDAMQPARLAQLREVFAGEPRVEVGGISGTDDPHLLAALDGAFGVIFAVARPQERAPKTLRVESLARLRRGGIAVDISIDEGGAIHDPNIRAAWSSKETIPYLTRRIAADGIDYRALSNMPRAYPHGASAAHGEEILPYIAALLFLSAQLGGPAAVQQEIAARAADTASPDPALAAPGHVLDALIQDLRNGLAFSFSGSRVTVHDIIADKDRVCSHLYGAKVPFEVSLPPKRDYGIAGVEEALQTSLRIAQQHGVGCTFISHLGLDAARALGVAEDDVLKCIVLKRGDGELAAAICEGTKHIDLERFEQAAQSAPWELATPEEVAQAVGSVAPLALLARLPVYVNRGVLAKRRVWISAGSEHAGIGLSPLHLERLGAEVAPLTGGPHTDVAHTASHLATLPSAGDALV